MGAKPGLGTRAPPPQAAHGLDAMVSGAQEHFLAAKGLLGSFLLRAWAPCTAGHAVGPRSLVQGRRLDEEVAEALHGLRHLRREVGEVARGTVQESPQRR